MSPTLTTFLFEAANFLVLAAVLSWLFFQPIRQALADRRSGLASEEKQASEKLAEAQQLQQQIAAAHAHLQVELNELRTRELEMARKKADQLLADARAAAERALEVSRRQAVRMSDTQRDTLAEVAAAAAAESVDQLLRRIGGPDVHAALIQSACRQLRAVSRDDLSPVKVESAQSLSPQDRAALDEAMGSAAQTADYRTVEELGVGVRISSAKGLIDATASGLAGFARQALVKEMIHRANHPNSLQIGYDE